MKEQHLDEFEVFEKEFEEEKRLKSIMQEKSKLEDKVNKIEKMSKKIKEEIEKMEGEQHLEKSVNVHDKVIRDCMDFEKIKRNVEIKRVENFLREKENEYGCMTLSEVVQQVGGIERMIQSKQVRYLR